MYDLCVSTSFYLPFTNWYPICCKAFIFMVSYLFIEHLQSFTLQGVGKKGTDKNTGPRIRYILKQSKCSQE